MTKKIDNETISIVVPAYNSEKVIKPCLDSILKSSYEDFEVIVINDGSKDNTLKIIKEYAKKDNRIKIIDKKNAGQAEARNDGIRNAIGKYIMFIDADDYINVDYLESMLNYLKDNKADVVISGYTAVDENFKPYAINRYKNTKFSQFSMLMPWGKLIKKELLDKYNILFENIKYWEDHVFSFVIYSYASKVVTFEENVGYNYFYNVNGLTKNDFLAFKVDVLPAHESTLKTINPKAYKDDKDFWNYAFLKGSIYHLLQSGKNANVKQFLDVDKEVLGWYEDNICKLSKTIILKEEKLKIRLIISIYLFLRKTKLLKLFLKIYCTGK